MGIDPFCAFAKPTGFWPGHLSPRFTVETQIHELGHSLDIITSGGNPFASSELRLISSKTTHYRLARPVAHSGLFPHPIDDCKALIAGLIIAESTGAAVPWGHSLWQFRAISFPLRASAEMTEEVKRPLPVNVPFGLLVFLLIAIGGTVVASRLVAPKKGVAC
jgi:hypothetical protein